jgi:hypothetical protein
MSDDGYRKPPSFSFGIELETIITFHEAAIKPYIVNPNASLSKLDPDDVLRDALKPKRRDYPTVKYKSWAIEGDGPGPSYCENPDATVSRNGTAISVRAYKDEPLRLVKDRLSKSRVPFLQDMHIHWDPQFNKQQSYGQWTITGDPTLEGLTSTQKKEALLAQGPRNSRKRVTLDESSFDSYGVEFVSPVYESKNDIPALVSDIKALSNAMKFDGVGNKTSESGFISTCTKECALHVHVGYSDNHPIDTAVLRQLAFLLIVYEHEIVRLISKHRQGQIYGIPDTNDGSGTQLRSQMMSNREFFYWNPDFDEPFVRAVRGDGAVTPQKYRFRYKPLDQIRKILLPENRLDDEDKDLDDLIEKVCEGKYRGRCANFSYARRDPGGKTIEFRQHEGTIDPEAIQHWVLLCIGLLEVAWSMANASFGIKSDCWDDVWIGDLFDSIDLPRKSRRFFRKKMREMGDNGQRKSLDEWYEEEEELPPFDEAGIDEV